MKGDCDSVGGVTEESISAGRRQQGRRDGCGLGRQQEANAVSSERGCPFNSLFESLYARAERSPPFILSPKIFQYVKKNIFIDTYRLKVQDYVTRAC